MQQETVADDNNSPTSEGSKSVVRRRTIVKGSAWSIPVIAATIATPAAAASGCVPGSQTFGVPDLNQAAGGQYSWIVPAGVTAVSFSLAGGAGGRGDISSRIGGSGALVTGTATVTPGQILTVYVGQGGSGQGTQKTGGGGYGSGGSTTTSPDTYVGLGGGGGGGSAIVSNGAPLAIAGGGGGGGSIGWSYDLRSGGLGGNAGTDGQAVIAGPVIAGGGYASGASGVASGAYMQTTPGLAASGQNGANGVVDARLGADGVSVERVGSGAGGGGYTGGGSGAIAYRSNGTLAVPIHDHAAGAGAGGSSHLAPGVVGTINNAGGSAPNTTGTRSPGSVTLSWSC